MCRNFVRRINIMKRLALILVLSAIFKATILAVHAASIPAYTSPRSSASPGDLDPDYAGFRDAGVIPNAPLDIRALDIQPDGKILVAGNKFNTFAVARYLSDGPLDPDFGDSGLVTTVIHSTQTAADAFDLAIQQDGKI